MLALTLQGFNLQVETSGAIVSGNGFDVRIIPECTFLLMGGLFLSFVVSYPASVSWRLKGLLFGFPALYAFNHLRLVTVYLLGTIEEQAFLFSHSYLGQIYSVIVVFSACALWLGMVSGRIKIRPILYFLVRFTLFSIPLFWLWLGIHSHYIGLIDSFLTGVFSLFHYKLIFSQEYSTYNETFNIVTIIALIAAWHGLSWRVKTRGLVTGISLAVLMHVVFKTLNLFVAAFGFLSLFPILVLMNAIGLLLLPIILLIWLMTVEKEKHAGITFK